jgi:hypothetical protein
MISIDKGVEPRDAAQVRSIYTLAGTRKSQGKLLLPNFPNLPAER